LQVSSFYGIWSVHEPGKIWEGSKQILLEAHTKGKAYRHCCVGMVESPHVRFMVGMVEACAKVSDIMIICMCGSDVKFTATTDRCADEDTWCLKFFGFDSWGEWNPHRIHVPTPIHLRMIRLRTPAVSYLNLSLSFFFTWEILSHKMKFWDWFHFRRVYTWQKQFFLKKNWPMFRQKDKLKINFFEKKYF